MRLMDPQKSDPSNLLQIPGAALSLLEHVLSADRAPCHGLAAGPVD
jgi:hypothetical protein